MSGPLPTSLIGCLLDVSGSMQGALEAGRPNEHAAGHLRAVLQAGLKFAQAEQLHDPNALVFVGIFGLKSNVVGVQGDDICPSAVDLCAVADALLGYSSESASGHDLLIARANKNQLSHITQYIREKLTDYEARIVDDHLERHPTEVQQFVDAIPSKRIMNSAKTCGRASGAVAGGAVVAGLSYAAGMVLSTYPPLTILSASVTGIGSIYGGQKGYKAVEEAEDKAVENSEALHLARRICAEWLRDFTEFVPRPVHDVVRIMERLQKRSETTEYMESEKTETTELDTLKHYFFGGTPMRDALSRSLRVFRNQQQPQHRILLLVSDGCSTDGDPLPIAHDLRQEKVSISTVYLTSDPTVHRELYYQPGADWNEGQQVLFSMASKVSGVRHPIPVLASVGWEIPSAGEVGLHATVSSSAALDEFCALLLSARFGTADALLDVIGRISQDSFVDDQHVKRCRDPSDQGNSGTCYAHAAAGVIHMSLLRIVGREGGYPTVEAIRKTILDEFPDSVRSMDLVLEAASKFYRPLKFQEVDEDGARQAVLRRRPVLAAFRLSHSGWEKFDQHFCAPPKQGGNPLPVLSHTEMAQSRSLVPDGGHAVILTGCDPGSLTFLNSWGRDWGNDGSFSVEDHTVLDLDGLLGRYRMRFYDVFWLEGDLTPRERQAYDSKVDEELRNRSIQHPSILELEARCPNCHKNAPLAGYKGSIRKAQCPTCDRPFTPEPVHLMDALYPHAGTHKTF